MAEYPSDESADLGQLTNANSMGEADLVDIGTQQITGTVDLFDPPAFPGDQNEQTVQLDTATSTGYTFAAGDDQIQSFSY